MSASLNLYVAGKNLDRARRAMDVVRSAGHHITYDWVARFAETSDMTQKAYDEWQAIRECDVLVYLWEHGQESARYEAGMAMGLAKPVLIVGKHQSHFFSLPNVHMVQSDNDIMQALSQIEPRGSPTGSQYE